MLEKMTVPSYLESELINQFDTSTSGLKSSVEQQITAYQEKIDYFSELIHFQGESDDLAIPITPDLILGNEASVVVRATIYFRQGLEMLGTSSKMSEFTSPLLEYYGFLQCVKGIIALRLNIIHENFLRYHGLKIVPDDTQYIKAEIKKWGVFQAYLIASGYPKKFLDKYKAGTITESLPELIKNADMFSIFITSWMLSTIVRYQPARWQEILSGFKEDQLIIQVRDFRRRKFPSFLCSLLGQYVHLPSGF